MCVFVRVCMCVICVWSYDMCALGNVSMCVCMYVCMCRCVCVYTIPLWHFAYQ